MPRKSIKATRLKVGLPWNLGELEFEPNEIQQRAAWSLYVELMTRIAVQPLAPEEGLLREALNSLYLIFGVTREILKDAGPEVAKGPNAFGPVAIRVLNEGLRPFLSYWHPLLKAHEEARPSNVNSQDHERVWERNASMRNKLKELQEEMLVYANALIKIAGVP